MAWVERRWRRCSMGLMFVHGSCPHSIRARLRHSRLSTVGLPCFFRLRWSWAMSGQSSAPSGSSRSGRRLPRSPNSLPPKFRPKWVDRNFAIIP